MDATVPLSRGNALWKHTNQRCKRAQIFVKSANVSKKAATPKRVAYLINQYPKVSHTFIRREILALERQGIAVDRIALRGWDDQTIVDQADIEEREKTRYVQKNGTVSLLKELAEMAFRRPRPFFTALAAALRLSRNAVRPLPYHLIYLAQACRVWRWMDGAEIAHLHAHFGTNPAEIAYLVHKLGGPNYSFTIHGQDEIEGAKQLHFPAKVGAAKFVVAISAYCRSQILREIPHETWNKMHVVHCGLTQDYFASAPASFPDPAVFLAVGRLSPEKGHLILLEAFAQVRRNHPATRLVFAGDGPMRADLERHMGVLGLQDAVEITGWVDAERIQSELSKSTALVQPSFIEGLPVVIMEAMAMRRPVISTYVAGIPELVLPGKTGWLVPAGDVSALSDAMEQAISADLETITRLGEVGHARARDRHLINVEAAKLADLIFEQAT